MLILHSFPRRRQVFLQRFLFHTLHGGGDNVGGPVLRSIVGRDVGFGCGRRASVQRTVDDLFLSGLKTSKQACMMHRQCKRI